MHDALYLADVQGEVAVHHDLDVIGLCGVLCTQISFTRDQTYCISCSRPRSPRVYFLEVFKTTGLHSGVD